MNGMNECCCGHKNPLSALLKFVALIIAVYGLWYHQFNLIIAAIVIAIIGCIIKAVMWKNTGAKPKNAKTKRKR